MKRLGLYIVLALAAAGSTGCSKFLEKEPDNRAKLNSPEKVALLLATAYPKGSYIPFMELSTDNVNERSSGGTPNVTMDPYNFVDVRDNNEDSPEFYWNSCYTAIAAANEALEAIELAPEADKRKYSASKGEALVARAYAHFMLVNVFSKFYNEASFANDPGIPYVTKPEKVVIEQYERGTVKETYEKIEKDLLEGLPLLKDESYTVPQYHFTRNAAYAFAARFYLFQKKYDDVLYYTQQFIGADVTTKLRPWNSTYLTYTRLELYANYQKATEPANLLLAETQSTWPRYVYSSRHSFDLTTVPLIQYVPIIGKRWSFLFQAYGNDQVYIPKINEYFVRASVNADYGDVYFMTPLFTMEEALFNRAEAMIYKGNYNGALDLINKYLSTRVYLYSASTDVLTQQDIVDFFGNNKMQENLIELLLAYKQSEFVHEGLRWFDILRYDIPVTHYFVNGSRKTLEAGSNRRVFQIPQSATLSGIELNPR
ncbi:RagB/SusD family nutrient uptake outer membrane protein [Filimonas effusa]|uniref:RagB/SusD family nutrient uptake outer membrane protein n=2 Tax=Filimonas effusa TaxID=2508721 RepID=A0A4Q1DES7_9BACT|nr:RagB/SusD family nutrient uptake outer membrane protein [Filimonas effusa]